MPNIEVIFPSEDQPSRIKKWKVSPGTTVTFGRILLLYQDVATGTQEKKFKAPHFGRILKILVKENEVVHPGQVIMVMEECKHPSVMKDLCAECGADLREEFAANPEKSPLCQANVPMVHSVPELKVTVELAEKIGREDKERLLKHQQLVLLVDLDQTIVHTTNDNIPANMEDVYHFQLYGPTSPWYHTRLRPHTRHFLSEISKLYELHICTFGARQYAHRVAAILDNDGKLFSHRILSRDECFDPQSKTANLKALFPCGVDMVCIIDDRDDVWQGCANLVQVKPYHFFLHTGDINVPPGLGKHDDPSPPKSLTEEVLEDTNSNENNENGEKTQSQGGETNNQKDEESEKNSGQEEKDQEKPKDGISEKDSKNIEKSEDVTKLKYVESGTSTEKTGEDSNKSQSSGKDKSGNGEGKQTSIKGEKSKSSHSEKSKSRRRHAKEKREKQKQEEAPQFNSQEMEDQDDYLLYLEDILKRIHTEFYAEGDSEPRSRTLKEIIPKVRSRVLKGLCLTFSGLVPNNQKLHQSRAYKVARAFGAQASQDLTEQTTHLVAIQPGTVKVREAKRQGKVKIVNPDWLWTCAERWEHVDERLYPLKEVPLHKAREFRKPPAHCSTPDHIEDITLKAEDNFANSINPLMVFSQEEIANMDKEVDEDMSDLEDMLNDSEEEGNNRKREFDSDSNDVYGNDYFDEPPCSKKRKKSSDAEDSCNNDSSDEENKRLCAEYEDDDEDDPVTRFRRGEGLPDDLDLGDNSQDSVENLEAEDMEDEREWNAMGAALEREFLSE
ncbi:RNA polymerase II subunit A C-terminal domain phosphatase [Nasonia vitripennis]|uniref:RNA polymerase II subunit A C-terminal domain phosphatase n=1 Tax=Nasonia vitripennis TaxID=7425 RepID=A0A7M7QSE5_NASVI|nr:RNA polymerase II subunit A C-terminal domain phosphatase [Nasonia vitripennis]XP_032453971.1 RNA polymerase II subunit A C-terminal domain phosphatase [Nasonia vitripennis]XP_032453972.1 RNA polymerase II subunit A C-terminal domain phosphatase [Nasonia vitripennis]XP_032453973.1 RNA polymerase II subunit A C-terminal domain phosphatase [Nasonia vitripennis]XP_032453974.1 RNA polymerase II subunit A C-terminal domain phosphatase [Nasonia vitripennis]